PGEAEHRGDERDDEEDGCPAKHGSILLFGFVVAWLRMAAAAARRGPSSESRHLHLVDLALDLLLPVAEALLNDAVQLVGRAFGLQKVVITELSPDPLGLALDLLPLPLQLVLICCTHATGLTRLHR